MLSVGSRYRIVVRARSDTDVDASVSFLYAKRVVPTNDPAASTPTGCISAGNARVPAVANALAAMMCEGQLESQWVSILRCVVVVWIKILLRLSDWCVSRSCDFCQFLESKYRSSRECTCDEHGQWINFRREQDTFSCVCCGCNHAVGWSFESENITLDAVDRMKLDWKSDSCCWICRCGIMRTDRLELVY